MEFVDDCGFANTRVPGDKNKLRLPSLSDPIKRRKKGVDFPLPAIEFLRNQQSVRRIVRANGEWFDVTMCLPFIKASPKIGLEARSGLITPLSILCEKSHDEGGEHVWGRTALLLGPL